MRLTGLRCSAIGAALLLTTGLVVAMPAQATQGDGGGGSTAQPPPSHVPSQKGDAPTAGDFTCPAKPPSVVEATCVLVRNLSSQSLTSPTITPDQGTTVLQAPKGIAAGENGGWATFSKKGGDGANVVFNVPGGQSRISYDTETTAHPPSVTMTVTGESDPPHYYCTIALSRQGGWTFLKITYSYMDNGSPGNCTYPPGTKGTGPATPAPSPTPHP